MTDLHAHVATAIIPAKKMLPLPSAWLVSLIVVHELISLSGQCWRWHNLNQVTLNRCELWHLAVIAVLCSYPLLVAVLCSAVS